MDKDVLLERLRAGDSAASLADEFAKVLNEAEKALKEEQKAALAKKQKDAEKKAAAQKVADDMNELVKLFGLNVAIDADDVLEAARISVEPNAFEDLIRAFLR